jgi:small nuclear ribonucleoprotein D3
VYYRCCTCSPPAFRAHTPPRRGPQGLTITIEMKNNTYYRGRLDEAEDNFNCRMSHVTVTDSRGRVSHLEQVYLRGSHMRFVILPDILKHAPMFKRVLATKKGRVGASGLGRIRAQAIQRAGGSRARAHIALARNNGGGGWRRAAAQRASTAAPPGGMPGAR